MKNQRFSKYDIRILLLLAIISLISWIIAQYGLHFQSSSLQEKMLLASTLMEEAIYRVRECRANLGIAFTPDDINQTGLIGVRYSAITTTIGSLEAKRTTTNPNFAGLMVYLLDQAGAKPGDAIAIGASGSFPALIIATLAAAKVLDLVPILICSLGASQWGANELEFTWLIVEDCLVKAGWLPENFKAVAVSLGGDKDTAQELSLEAREALLRQINQYAKNKEFIYLDDLTTNVQKRLAIYYQKAGNRRIAAFVSIGGNWADLGEDPAILSMEPGLNVLTTVPETSKKGVIFEMASQGIPIIHLLNIKDLATKYGLPWDPSPLPKPGEGYLYKLVLQKFELPFIILSASFLTAVGLILVVGRLLQRKHVQLFKTDRKV
jgi:poly-gamma-glutamate system protein